MSAHRQAIRHALRRKAGLEELVRSRPRTPKSQRSGGSGRKARSSAPRADRLNRPTWIPLANSVSSGVPVFALTARHGQPCQPFTMKTALAHSLIGFCLLAVALPAPAAPPSGFVVTEDADQINVIGVALDFAIRKNGYVSGVSRGSFLDKQTGFRDPGFGLDI